MSASQESSSSSSNILTDDLPHMYRSETDSAPFLVPIPKMSDAYDTNGARLNHILNVESSDDITTPATENPHVSP